MASTPFPGHVDRSFLTIDAAEGDLDGAQPARPVGVVERLPPAVQRVGGDGLGEGGDRVGGHHLGGHLEGAAPAEVGLRAGRGVGTHDLELAEPGGREVGGVGHARQHDAAAGPGGTQDGLERALAAHGVDGDVDPAQQVRRPELGLHLERAGDPAQPPQRLARRHHLGGAHRERVLALVRVLGDDGDLAGVGERAERVGGEQAHDARTADEHPVARADAGPQRGVHRAGHRLDDHGLLVGVALGHRVQLAAVRREHLAPAAAGVLAEAGLQTGRERADGDPGAPVGTARGAVGARLDAAGEAGEHRVDHHAGARGQVVAVVEQVGHHLVAGHERQRHETGEVVAGAARQRTEVGAADPGQPGAQPRPARPRDRRLVAGGEPQRRRVARQDAGHPAAHRASGHVPRDRAVHLQRQHHRAAPAGFRARATASGLGQSTICHRCRRACR